MVPTASPCASPYSYTDERLSVRQSPLTETERTERPASHRIPRSRGALAANYTEALRFLWDGRCVRGVRARDCLSADEFDIRAKLVLNAAGPWADYLLL